MKKIKTISLCVLTFMIFLIGCKSTQSKENLVEQNHSNTSHQKLQTSTGINYDPLILNIQSGMIKGELSRKNENIRVFKGLPYAGAPINDNRWRAPLPPVEWTGTRDATEFGAACPQTDRRRTLRRINEDCLFLNIWAPSKQTKPLPVMVWIHGGGFTNGSSDQIHYDGTSFAERDVVLVTINYRLGPLGFLAHPELSSETSNGTSGNYGFLDQIAALKWIKNNITSFGGDPDNVTIFGESAGGTSVAILRASPLATGLFDKAIIQSPWFFGYINQISGSVFAPMAANQSSELSGYKDGQAWVNSFDLKTTQSSISQLRDVKWQDLVLNRPYYKARPLIDGVLLTAPPSRMYIQNLGNNTPTIVGTNKNEGNFYRKWFSKLTKENFEKQIRLQFGENTSSILSLYTNDDGSLDLDGITEFVTDAWFVFPAVDILNQSALYTEDLFHYKFSRALQSNPDLGSPHAMEIRYVFNTLKKEYGNNTDRLLAAIMQMYWVQFAKTGNPNQDGLLKWSSYTKENKAFLEFDDPLKQGVNFKQPVMDIFRISGHLDK
jgi:para-nitrobenzyl esterase